MNKKICMAIAIINLSLFFNVSYSTELLAKKSNDVSRKIIQRADVAGSDEELRMMLVQFPPAYSNIVHYHPVGALCYVIQGSAESQYEGEELRTFHAGESYQDKANKKHLIFRNASDMAVLKFTCVAKIKKDKEFMLPIRLN